MKYNPGIRYTAILFLFLGFLAFCWIVWAMVPVVFYHRINGQIVFLEQDSVHIFAPGKFGGVDHNINKDSITYSYIINDKPYSGNMKTRLLVHPNMDFRNELIQVYYNPVLPKISVLYVGDIFYLFVNITIAVFIMIMAIVLQIKAGIIKVKAYKEK